MNGYYQRTQGKSSFLQNSTITNTLSKREEEEVKEKQLDLNHESDPKNLLTIDRSFILEGSRIKYKYHDQEQVQAKESLPPPPPYQSSKAVKRLHSIWKNTGWREIVKMNKLVTDQDDTSETNIETSDQGLRILKQTLNNQRIRLIQKNEGNEPFKSVRKVNFLKENLESQKKPTKQSDKETQSIERVLAGGDKYNVSQLISSQSGLDDQIDADLQLKNEKKQKYRFLTVQQQAKIAENNGIEFMRNTPKLQQLTQQIEKFKEFNHKKVDRQYGEQEKYLISEQMLAIEEFQSRWTNFVSKKLSLHKSDNKNMKQLSLNSIDYDFTQNKSDIQTQQQIVNNSMKKILKFEKCKLIKNKIMTEQSIERKNNLSQSSVSRTKTLPDKSCDNLNKSKEYEPEPYFSKMHTLLEDSPNKDEKEILNFSDEIQKKNHINSMIQHYQKQYELKKSKQKISIPEFKKKDIEFVDPQKDTIQEHCFKFFNNKSFNQNQNSYQRSSSGSKKFKSIDFLKTPMKNSASFRRSSKLRENQLSFLNVNKSCNDGDKDNENYRAINITKPLQIKLIEKLKAKALC